jgi:hypothetical protein
MRVALLADLRSKLAAFLFVLALAASAVFPASLGADEPKFQFELKRKDDSIEVVREPKRTLFVITSLSGIGTAKIVRSEGPWPSQVVLRLRHAPGQGLKALENFELTVGRMRLKGNDKQSGKLPFFLADAEGKFPPDDAPSGTLNVTFSPQAEALDVVLPANLLAGDRVEIVWIDFYR